MNSEYRELDWLGFVLDTFLANRNDNSQSNYFHPRDQEDLDELEAYLYARNVKYRLKSDKNGYFITVPGGPPEGAISSVNFSIAKYNSNKTGGVSFDEPCDGCGAARGIVHGRACEPDTSYQVCGRQSTSPNIVFEVHHRNGGNQGLDLATTFHELIRNKISGTNAVNIAVGIKIHERVHGHHGDPFPALACVYLRGANNQPYMPAGGNVSFGSAAPDAQQLAHWNGAVNATHLAAVAAGHAEPAPPALVGVGLGGPPCAAPNTPQYVLWLPEGLLLAINEGFPLVFAAGAWYNPDPAPHNPAVIAQGLPNNGMFALDLYPVQRSINRKQFN